MPTINISPSAIDLYLDCKKRFVLNTIQKLYVKAPSEMPQVFGSAIHKTLANFYTNKQYSKTNLLLGWESVFRHYIDTDMAMKRPDSTTILEHIEKGYKTLENTYSMLESDGLLNDATLVEQRIEIPYTDNILLVAKLDILVNDIIVDYKTGAKVWDKGHMDYQMPFYVYAFRRTYKTIEKGSFYYYVVNRKKIVVEVTELELQKVEHMINEIVEFCKTPVMIPNPTKCRFCPYKPTCDDFKKTRVIFKE